MSDRSREALRLFARVYAARGLGKEHEFAETENQSLFSDWKTFLKIGCFGFGGPMAVFSLLENELVRKRKILTQKDFLEGAVLGDVLPGPVTMDIVSYTGYRLREWKGAFIATGVFILPSFILMILLSYLYSEMNLTPRLESVLKCLGAAVTGLIVSVGMRLGEKEIKDYFGVCIFLWAFASSLLFKLDILLIVGMAGLAGILLHTGRLDGFQTQSEGD